MRFRWWKVPPASVLGAWAWSAAASYLYLNGMGFGDDFEAPWLQWWIAAPYIIQGGWHNLTALKALAWFGFAGALPSIAVIAIGLNLWRRRYRHLVSPSSGGVRPIEPGVTDNHGHATILTDKEALRRFPGPYGVVIGETRGGKPGLSPLVIDPITEGAGHSAVFVGTGGGKSTSAITMLLHWPGAAVVLDPSAEIGSMLQSALEGEGKRVILMNPGVSNSGFNALAWIDPKKPLAGADVRSMVTWIFPPENSGNVKSDGYFEPSGKALCTAILADLIWSDRPADEKTLKTFRKLVVTPESLMPKMLAGIHRNSNSQMARDIAGSLMKMTPKQFSGVYGTSVQSTDFLSDPDMAALVSGDSFHVRDILDGSTVVFAQIPLRALRPSPGIGRVIVGALMSAIYDSGREVDGRVLFCLDEAHALGAMALLDDALVVGRKYGIVLQYLFQSTGMAKRIFGDDGVVTFYNNLAWRGYASIRDDTTAEMVSKDFGEISVMAYSEGDNTGTQRPAGLGWGSRSSGKTTNMHEIKRRLVLPQELKKADPDELFVVSPHGNMRLRMPVYFRRPDLSGLVKRSIFSGEV